MKVLQKLN